MLAFISQKHNQFTYFSMQLGEPDWSKKDVLDFGGNVGNILRDPNSNIDSKRYWCIDVSKEAIECGRRAFPESHWIAYNRRCFFFNPEGIPGLHLPRMAQTFDYYRRLFRLHEYATRGYAGTRGRAPASVESRRCPRVHVHRSALSLLAGRISGR